MKMLMSNQKSNVDDALHYLETGFSVIPVGRDKKPIVEWKEYQTRLATEEEVRQWWTKSPTASIGIVTGKVSGISVVDVDAKSDGLETLKTLNLPMTWIVKTGGGGWHYYYQYHPDAPQGTALYQGVDCRNDGGYVVAPPSVHASGQKYEWSFVDGDRAEFPIHLFTKNQIKKDWEKILQGTNEGGRNENATKVFGKLLRAFALNESASVWEIGVMWNQKNKPPLPEQELRAVFNSIQQAEKRSRIEKQNEKDEMKQRESQSSQLLKIIEQTDGLVLFQNEYHDPHVRLPIGNHLEIWPCRSKSFRRWANKIFWDSTSKAISSEALNTALSVLEGKACFDGEEYTLFNRVASQSDAIWYDMANPDWQVIKITVAGWEVVSAPPIIFRRYAHQQAQVAPAIGGDVKRLLSFVNIADVDNQLLLLVFLVACYIPDFPHPLLSVHGAQGSAKSMLSRILRKLIDPSSIEAATFPRDANELTQLFSHHWSLFFDNVSALSTDTSDTLCKAITGDGFSKRELYSDDDDVIYSFRRCIGINGINLAITKPDLLERSILLELERIEPDKRCSEQELWKNFEIERPIILGGVFNAVSKAMAIRDSIQLPQLPRMADFALWGRAIAEALGYGQEAFTRAYIKNISGQNEQVLSESLVASAVRSLLESIHQWEGTPSELLTLLTDIAKLNGVSVEKEKEWPKAANSLSRRLNELKTNLATDGIKLLHDNRNKKRIIILEKQVKNIVDTVTPLLEANSLFNNSDDVIGVNTITETIPSFFTHTVSQNNDINDDNDTLSITEGGDLPIGS